MASTDRRGRVSLLCGIAALVLVVFWFLEYWSGAPGVFGIPRPWRRALMGIIPMFFMMFGYAALLLGRGARKPERDPATPQTASTAASFGRAMGCTALAAGVLLIVLFAIGVMLYAAMDAMDY